MRKHSFVGLVGAAWLLSGSPALADIHIAETDHFIIYSERSRAEIERLAERFENYDWLMRKATSISDDKQPVKVRIFEVEDMAEVQEALNTEGGVAGFYNSNILGPYLVTPRKTSGLGRHFTPEIVAHHEYAHHFMLQYFPAIYPSWYVEGFAELIGSSLELKDGRIGYGMPARERGNGIAADWIPLTEVLTQGHIREMDPYGQGWALTHYFTFDSNRSQQFRKYLQALRSGRSPKEAASVFGDLKMLDRDARRYVTNGVFDYRPVKTEIRRPVVHSLRRASPAEEALLDEVAAFRDDELSLYKKQGWRERERRFREKILARTRETVARHPNDPFALYFLAESEHAAENSDEAFAAVTRLLAVQPDHVRGLARKSMLLSARAGKASGPAKAAMRAEARQLAVRANKSSPSDPLPLLAYYQSFHLTGETPSAPAIEGLMQAVSTLPENSAIRQSLVDGLAANKRYAEAIAWLLPIANDPRDSPRRDAAREQLAKLQATLKGDAAPAVVATATKSD